MFNVAVLWCLAPNTSNTSTTNIPQITHFLCNTINWLLKYVLFFIHFFLIIYHLHHYYHLWLFLSPRAIVQGMASRTPSPYKTFYSSNTKRGFPLSTSVSLLTFSYVVLLISSPDMFLPSQYMPPYPSCLNSATVLLPYRSSVPMQALECVQLNILHPPLTLFHPWTFSFAFLSLYISRYSSRQPHVLQLFFPYNMSPEPHVFL